MNLIQPKCHCLQCEYWSLVFFSTTNVHRCLECDIEIQNKLINNVVSAFTLKRTEPLLIKTFNKIYCISCLMTGSVFFGDGCKDVVSCAFCKYEILMDDILDAKANAYKTKLIEESYNYTFTWIKI